MPKEVSEAEIRRKIRLIEETLASFGVPGRVVEVEDGVETATLFPKAVGLGGLYGLPPLANGQFASPRAL